MPPSDSDIIAQTTEMVVRTLDEYIEAFRCLIEVGSPHVAFGDADPTHAYNGLPATVSDWQQIQWEFMVEGFLRWTGQLDGYLIWYGEGMDEGMSMRNSEPEALMTHQVHFLPREGAVLRELISGEEITFPERGLPFSEFVSRPENSWYVRQPPFDFVLADELPEEFDQNFPMVFPRESIRFVLRQLDHPVGV